MKQRLRLLKLVSRICMVTMVLAIRAQAQHTIRVVFNTLYDDTCVVSWNGASVTSRPGGTGSGVGGGQYTDDRSYNAPNPGPNIHIQIVNTGGKYYWESVGNWSINARCTVFLDGRGLASPTITGYFGRYQAWNWDASTGLAAASPLPPASPAPEPVTLTTRSYPVALANGQVIQHVEQCFGAVGAGCEGVSILAPGQPHGDGTYTMYVSVGSIEHDNCCLKNPNGNWCSPDMQNPMAAIGHVGMSQIADWLNQNGACAAEWRKAFWNAMDHRQWQQRFPISSLSNGHTSYPSGQWSDDLTPVAARPSVLPDPLDNYDLRGGNYGETATSIVLAAPDGSGLDIDDARFCASGSFRRTWTAGFTWVDRPLYGLRWASAWGECGHPSYGVQSISAPAAVNVATGATMNYPLLGPGAYQVLSVSGGVRAQISGTNLLITGVSPGAAVVTLRDGGGKTGPLNIAVTGSAPAPAPPPAPAAPDPRILIAQVYNEYLGRPAQAAEIQYWLGVPNLSAAMLANGCEQLLRTNAAERAATIQRAFATIGRTPNAQEMAQWTSSMERDGASYQGMAHDLSCAAARPSGRGRQGGANGCQAPGQAGMRAGQG